ncbi:hypothetical protein A1507_09955 [Methylomonas koyamae]|uniref:Uncharacterized protein n=1 Tax=Methylomonas koyamae TaxID=702114 RepID=A0A177NJJ7_9GAMM|nr:hypothetical protein A1507_09955 [Methylomonas koyamae]
MTVLLPFAWTWMQKAEQRMEQLPRGWERFFYKSSSIPLFQTGKLSVTRSLARQQSLKKQNQPSENDWFCRFEAIPGSGRDCPG